MSRPDAPPTDRLRRILLSVRNRRRIYEAIVHRPGLHVRALCRTLDLALGSIEHHLHQLEKHGLVFSHRSGRRRTFYCADSVHPDDAVVLHALGKPLCQEILTALTLADACSVTDVAERLDLSPSIASHHLRRLRDEELLEHHRVGRESVYLVRDPDRLLRLLGRQTVPGTASGLADLVARTQATDHRLHAPLQVASDDISMIVPSP